MSVWKQVILCLVLVFAAAGGWYAYTRAALPGQSVGADLTAGPGAATGGGPASVGAPAGAAGQGNRIPGLLGRGNAVNVITAAVETDRSGETIVALGTAKAARSVTLYPQASGVVAEILFTPGASVEEGAPLLWLDDEEQRIAVDRARVSLERARAALERSEALAQSRTIADVVLSEAISAAELAEIEMRSAEVALRRRTVTAPFSGVTGLTDASVGDLVATSTAITTLDDLSTVNVGFEVPERWAARIAAGQPISASVQALPAVPFAGTISAVDNRVDEATRTLRVEAVLANEAGALKAGMAVTVVLTFETDEQLVVPSAAVQWDRAGSYVWKVVDNAARRADTTIVRRQTGVISVTGDIAAGDRVVVEGIQGLREGAGVAEVNQLPAIVDPEVPVGDAGGGAAPLRGDVAAETRS